MFCSSSKNYIQHLGNDNKYSRGQETPFIVDLCFLLGTWAYKVANC